MEVYEYSRWINVHLLICETPVKREYEKKRGTILAIEN